MVDQPHRDLLDRTQSASEVSEHFRPSLQLAQEVVDYGTNLIVRCLGSTTGEIVDVVGISVFGKQVVAALDGVEQLARTGSRLAACVVARSLLEASLYCEWVLSAESDERARAYYVANLRRELAWSRRALPDTHEHQQFREAMGDLYQDPLRDLPTGREDVDRRIAEVEAHLNGEGFCRINAEFDRLKDDRPFDPSWHRVAGARSLREVAQDTGRLAEYTIFYSLYSQVTHSGSYKDHLEVRDGSGLLHPIRGLHQISEALENSFTFTFRTYRVLLTRYRPDELPTYNRLYIREWRERYRAIPEVTVQMIDRPTP